MVRVCLHRRTQGWFTQGCCTCAGSIATIVANSQHVDDLRGLSEEVVVKLLVGKPWQRLLPAVLRLIRRCADWCDATTQAGLQACSCIPCYEAPIHSRVRGTAVACFLWGPCLSLTVEVRTLARFFRTQVGELRAIPDYTSGCTPGTSVWCEGTMPCWQPGAASRFVPTRTGCRPAGF